jgi:hypothetical protein
MVFRGHSKIKGEKLYYLVNQNFELFATVLIKPQRNKIGARSKFRAEPYILWAEDFVFEPIGRYGVAEMLRDFRDFSFNP